MTARLPGSKTASAKKVAQPPLASASKQPLVTEQSKGKAQTKDRPPIGRARR